VQVGRQWFQHLWRAHTRRRCLKEAQGSERRADRTQSASMLDAIPTTSIFDVPVQDRNAFALHNNGQAALPDLIGHPLQRICAHDQRCQIKAERQFDVPCPALPGVPLAVRAVTAKLSARPVLAHADAAATSIPPCRAPAVSAGHWMATRSGSGLLSSPSPAGRSAEHSERTGLCQTDRGFPCYR
jgi:hypothetical protein